MEWNLSSVELRVLGALVEKEATTPEQYPLSVNALRNACNQKSNREPVMALGESDVREAITSLTRRGLVRTASGYGGRVSKFAHRFGRAGSGIELSPDQVAVLCLLFLRGPQTLGELRARAQRIHAFADTAAVEDTLSRLAAHSGGPLVRRLEREPGRREHRYAHCLGDGTEGAAPTADPGEAATGPAEEQPAGLETRVTALEDALAAIEARIEQLERGGDGS